MSPWPSLATVAALLVYYVLCINVGRARAKYNVPAPQVSGDPNFERVLRVQMNTVEQLVIFLPLLWLFSFFISPLWAGVLGGVWAIGRIIFAWGYYQAAEKRAIGFGIGALVTIALFIGSIFGIVRELIAIAA